MKKIVIIGPESTGKSSLCQALAGHYHSLWCPEYAREYLLRYGTNYSYENLLLIARAENNLFGKNSCPRESNSRIFNEVSTKHKYIFLLTEVNVKIIYTVFFHKRLLPFFKIESIIDKQLYRKTLFLQ